MFTCLALAAGCTAGGPPIPPQQPRVVPHRQTPLLRDPGQNGKPGELLHQAQAALITGQPDRAWELLERARQLPSDASLQRTITYYRGVASDEQGEHERSLGIFLTLLDDGQDQGLTRQAYLRSIRLAVHLERWAEGAVLARRFMSSFDEIRPFEKLVADTAIAFSYLKQADLTRAELLVEESLNEIESQGWEAPGQLPKDLAILFFLKGETVRGRAEAQAIDPEPSRFASSLELRCQRVLEAQSAYSKAMRAYDPHWSALAGLRTADLYSRLYQDLLSVAPPKQADSDERRELFRGAMRLKYTILLRKAVDLLDKILKMTNRTGVRSVAVRRTEEAHRTLSTLLANEEKEIDRLPYSRADLEEALKAVAEHADEGHKEAR